MPTGFTESTIRYMMNVKTVDNLDDLIAENRRLPPKVRGEAMTIAEALEQKGHAKGIIEGEARGKTKGQMLVAINLLKSGMPVDKVVELTGLDKSAIEKLAREQDLKFQ